MLLLAGDIGATKATLAIVSSEIGPRAPLVEVTYSSARYAGLEAILDEFLTQARLPVERVSLGVAGPVVAGRAMITNLGWVVEEAQLREALKLSSVWMVNDLVAIAYAVPFLEPADVHPLNVGEPVAGGSIAVIAPGTGLGEAFLTWDGTRYHAHPSEGGHTDFAPTTPLQIELLRYLQARFEHVSYERVCSGIGLPNIYVFLKDSGYAPEPSWLAERLVTAGDPTPIIAQAALDRERPCELCRAALDMFVEILGAEAGNLALKVWATGGVYLGGGIPRRILPALENGRFLAAFRDKGRLSESLARMPIHVILNPKTALLGAAYYGLRK